MEVSKREELILYKFEDRDSKDPVTFGSSVVLQTAEGYFFSFNGSQDLSLRVEKCQKFDGSNNNIAKLTKWTILDVKNPANRNIVTPFEDICFKGAFG